MIVSISNQKGGVGKTTTAVNLSTALAAVGYRTLLVDLDPQRNATVSFGFGYTSRNSYKFITSAESSEMCFCETFVPNLYLVPSSMELASVETGEGYDSNSLYLLKERLKGLQGKFDFVFLDCPPTFGRLSLNAWNASNWVLVPLQCEYFALEGLVSLLNNILKTKKRFNSKLSISGIVLTMYDRRGILSQQIETDVRKNLGEKVYKVVIPRNIKVAEAPSHGQPVLFYDVKCPGSVAYMDLAREFLERHHYQKELV